jgi:hypothetical protein
MRIVAPWYSPVLPNGVVDEKCAVEKALDFGGCNSRPGNWCVPSPGSGSRHIQLRYSETGRFFIMR